MKSLLQDVRFGLRVLGNSPGFTMVAMLTLALGVAATATVFSWIDGLLLHPFGGARDSGRLAVMEMLSGAPTGGTQVSYLDYRDYRFHLRSIDGMLVHREDVFSIASGATAQPVWGELVSGNYFDVLGVRPELGRTFTREEDGDKPGAYPVMVISDAFWRSRLHADPAVIGRTLRVNRHELTIVGVAPAVFRGAMPGLAYDAWIPVTMATELGMAGPTMLRNRGYRNTYGLVRLKPGVSLAEANAEAALFAHSLASAYPKTNLGVVATVLPLWRFHSAAPDLLLQPLRILMAASILVLLVVCANVTNLLLARAVTRQREFGIRVALGAGRWRLVRQLLIEMSMLSAGGAVGGLVLSSWMQGSIAALIPPVGINVVTTFDVNGRILAFTVLICAATVLIAGGAPALFAVRADVNATLREGGRQGSSSGRSHRTRGLLVIAEVALATVALIGAGLFTRSFLNARAIHPGFDRNNVLLSRFYFADSTRTQDQVKAFCRQLRERMEAEPGVLEVNYTDYAPLGSTAGPWDDFEVPGYVPAPGEFMTVSRSMIAPGFFHLLRIPLLQGRDFTPADDAKQPRVAIVNQAFARKYLGGGEAVGRKLQLVGAPTIIVGVVRDSKYFNVAEAALPYVYTPFDQRFSRGAQLSFLVRTTGDPMGSAETFRRAAGAIDANAGSCVLLRLTEWTEVTMVPQKMASRFLSALGLLSLLLAGLGLYSLIAYAVSQRTHEIGIRMALGARTLDVLRIVMGQGMVLTGIGMAIGLAAALSAARVISGMLVNVSGADPLTFAGVAVFLAAVAALASFLPAWRAARVDPTNALRSE